MSDAARKELLKQEILEMYAQRASLTKIARELELPWRTVSNWLDEAIREIKDPNPVNERQKDLILVDSAIRALIPDVLAGKPQSHMALNRWLERRAKYLGLDQPEKLELDFGFTGSIEDEVAALCERLGLQLDNGTD